MLNAIGDYIRTLAIFMLFMSFVGIVAPSSKYKDYIKLIMGFMLVLIMVSPIINIMGAWDNVLIYLEDELFTNNYTNVDISHAEETQRRLIAENIQMALSPQIKDLVLDYGFVATDVSIYVSKEDENFLEILGIYIQLQRTQNTGVIQIDVIMPSDNVEDSRINGLKNAISNFYNLSVNHIHITH